MLIGELKEKSGTFARLWDDHAVLEREGGMRTFDHSRYGRMCFEQLTLKPSAAPFYKLVMLIPRPAFDAEAAD